MAEQDDPASAIKEFQEAVNMTASGISRWLGTGNSQAIGQQQDGRSLVELLHKKRTDYTEDDIAQMRRVIGYVHRYLAQKPSGDISETHWRYSLMIWGHDPMND
jgi:hypothetical protein